ncbi:hypothetical protein GGI22_006714, partial [Coemansia erecta]
MEALLVSANLSTRAPLELPVAMSPHFDARLMGIDIQIPRELMDPVSAPPPIAPAAILPNNPPPVHIQPAIIPQPSSIQPQSLANVPDHIQQPLVAPAAASPGSLLPQKNKAATDGTSSVAVAGVVSPTSTKKQKTDADVPSSSATMAPHASTATDEQAKPAVSRTKGRAKGSGGRKTSRASNSPAVAAKSTPPTAAAAAAAASAGGFTAVPIMTSAPHMHLQQPMGIGASPHIPVGSLQQPPQQPNAGNGAATAAQTMLVNGWIQSLRSQGITSKEDIHALVNMASQLHSPQVADQDKIQIRHQMEIAMTRARQNAAAAGASPAPTNVSVADRSPMVSAAISGGAMGQAQLSQGATPVLQRPPLPPQQQQQQQQQQQGVMSPATLPAQQQQQQQSVLNQLLQATLNALTMKLGVDVRQLVFMLTPDQFESNAREVCKDHPEIINNMQLLKTMFTHYSEQANLALKRQQQQQQQQRPSLQQSQISSPASAQAPPRVGQAAGGGPQTPIWQGLLHWESRQGENILHELTCPLSGYPGLNCTAQALKISDWPETLRVTEIISSSERFTEHCIQLGIPV